jgi:serine/threonine protein kinase
VYIARHKSTGTIYALKKINKKKIMDEKDKESLIREIKIHLKLSHPNIINFYGCFTSDKAIYFII